MHHFLPRSPFRGNISLLVIFILLGSSLIALLAMSQLKNLITYGATTSNYFKAYYLAKAGLELVITETSLRDAGFEVVVNSGDAVVSGNIFVGWEGFSPYFSTASIATIERGVPYCVNLKSSQSMVIPLFLDNKISSHKDFLIEAKSAQFSHFDESQTKGFSATITPTGRSVYFGIFAFSGDQMEEMLGMISQIGKNFSVLRNDDAEGVWSSIFANSTARKYFTILNGESSDIAVCIESRETAFAISMADISVWSHYGDTEVGLQANFLEPFPNFLQGLSEVTDFEVTDF